MEDKIKLEEELEFLKESFEAEVISKEEYGKAKARLEAQIKEIEETKPEEEKTEPIEEKVEKPTEEKKEELKEETKIEDKPKETDSKGEIEIKEIKEPSRFKKPEEEEVKEEEPLEVDEKEEDTNDIIGSNNNGFEAEGEKKKMSRWVPVAAVVFLIIIGYFSFLVFTSKTPVGEENLDGEFKFDVEAFVPACFSDKDCAEEGMIGFCNSPGSKDAECEFKEAVEVNFIVLNTNDCFNCDTSRVESIIKGWFPGARKEEMDINSEEGKILAQKLGVELLPAFIFDFSLEETYKFEELGGIFSKVGDKYLLSSSASGSTFYVNREEVPNKLEIFLMRDDASTEKTEDNIEEFLELFDGKVEYKKHFVDKKNALTKTLGINTFPTFLVNNKVRFSGVQPAETIKENFCKLNSLDECSEKLTESLV